MNINIAANLKRLRKQREITQEDLAGFLGVSFQAVSKWERGDGYPDITLLPSIANFFGITLDELMGMDELRNEEKRNEILKRAGLLASEGKISETVAALWEGLKLFPNDYAIMAELACYLDGHGTSGEERRKNQDEAIQLSERILEFCTDGEIRNNVQANICFALWRNGEKDRAVTAARKLPNLYKTEEFTLPRFLTGDEKIEFCQQVMQKISWAFWWIINLMVEESHYSDEQKIELLRKSIDVYKIVYEKEDYGFANMRIADKYEDIAVLLFQNGRIDEAFENLGKCAEHCAAYDGLAGEMKHTSLLVDALLFDKTNTSKPTEANTSRNVLNGIMANQSLYGQYMQDERMKRIIERLDANAN